MTPRERRERDELLVSLLAGGRSYREAATEAHCSLSTVKRRMSESGFRRAVEERRAELAQTVVNRLRGAAVVACDRLDGLLSDPDPRVRLSATQTVLGHFVRLDDHVNFDRRLGALEERLGLDREGVSA